MTTTTASTTPTTSSSFVVTSVGTSATNSESGLDFSPSSQRELTTMKFLSELASGGRPVTGFSAGSSSLPLLSVLSPRPQQQQEHQASFDSSGAKSPTISTSQVERRASFLAPSGKMMVDPIAPSPSSPTSTAAVLSPTGVTSGFSAPPSVSPSTSSSSLPLKSLGNMYLFGYSSFDDLACSDIIKFVNEHATTLTFPQKVRKIAVYVICGCVSVCIHD